MKKTILSLSFLFLTVPGFALQQLGLQSLKQTKKQAKSDSQEEKKSHRVKIHEKFIAEHGTWHGSGRKQTHTAEMASECSGEEFLNWHSGFIKRYAQWRKDNGLGQLPSFWTAIPKELNREMQAMGMDYPLRPPDRYDRIGVMGVHYEHTIHNYMHDAVSRLYKDDVIADPGDSPRSFYFWQIHGLVERFRKQWIATHSGMPAVSDACRKLGVLSSDEYAKQGVFPLPNLKVRQRKY